CHGASELVARLRVRTLHVSSLCPGRPSPRVEIRRTRFLRLIALLAPRIEMVDDEEGLRFRCADALGCIVLEVRGYGERVAVAAQRELHPKRVVRTRIV